MKLDKVRYLKRVILVSWVTLLICFLIKMLGGNIFVIVCENERFKQVCDFTDHNFIANYIVSFIYCLISLSLYSLSILEQTKFKKSQMMTILLTVLTGTFIKIQSVILGWIFDIWQMFIMNMIFLGKNYRKYIRIFIGAVLLILFQIISLIIKDIGIKTIGDSILEEIIFSIDIIIMEILYLAYTITKRKEN